MEEAEGGEEDDGGEPGGEGVSCAEEPSVKAGYDGDSGERGAQAGGEF